MVALADPPPAAGLPLDDTFALLRLFADWLRPRRDRVKLGYLIPERGGHGWYVLQTAPAYDFALGRELTAFGSSLIRRGYTLHTKLLPGSVEPAVPTDGIVVLADGSVQTYAH